MTNEPETTEPDARPNDEECRLFRGGSVADKAGAVRLLLFEVSQGGAPMLIRLPPAAADPNIIVAVSPPMAAHPNGVGPWPSHIAATYPYPAAVPGPIARCPDIIGTRSYRNDLDLRRRRC